MRRNISQGLNQTIFHVSLPFFLIKNGMIIGAGGMCLFLGSHGAYYWWLGTVFAVFVGVRSALHYSAHSIKLYDHDLLFQFGMFSRRTVSIPIWDIQLDIRQSLFGRVFDYGTIRQQWGNEIIEVRGVAPVNGLCEIVSERRRETLLLTRHMIDIPVFTDRRQDVEPQRQNRLTQDR